MQNVISIDPGVHYCATAWFAIGQLVQVEHRSWPLPEVWRKSRVVCEIPQVHDPRKQQRFKRPQDLIDLTLAAGRMTGNVECEYFLPAAWKGQLKCTCSARVDVRECTHHRRMVAELRPSELEVLQAFTFTIPTSERHNAYDAVSLGLVALGRLTPLGARGKKIAPGGSHT